MSRVFIGSCAPMPRPRCEEIRRITGVEVREATGEVEMRTGTVMQGGPAAAS